MIRHSINKIVPKKFLIENKFSLQNRRISGKKYINNNNDQKKSMNKTVEHFYNKINISNNPDSSNKEKKPDVKRYKQVKVNSLYKKYSKINSFENTENIYKNNIRFIPKRKRFCSNLNNKTSLEKDEKEKIKNIFDTKEQILDDLITKEKIEDLSKNCSIPFFEDKHYNYIKLIGEGSYGRIYLVEDKITKEEYALKKVLCTSYKELLKFIKEFELIYSLQNPNIMSIYKIQLKYLDQTTSSLYILMERAQIDWNMEIKRRKIAKKYYKETEIIAIIKQLSQGLLFLQKNKIAHRDIKPQNILIFPKNIFKIADMGEAKEVNRNRMQMATLRGSELFMSPLLYEGLKLNKKNIRHNPYKSDMFSLGLCFLYAISLNLNILEYIREMKDMNSIKNILNKFLDKTKYSDKLIEIIYRMIDLKEETRLDFEELENEIAQL